MFAKPPSPVIALAASGLLAGLLASPLAGPASAQDALGSGRALDRNLDPRSGGINAAVRQEDFRARNLIVTDNVVGGRGFRGSVGYAAESAFRQLTGSDDLYSFRRDSAPSNVTYLNFGSTFQRFRFGQDAGLLEYHRTSDAANLDTVDRSATAPGMRPGEIVEMRLRLDRLAHASSPGAVGEVLAEPRTIGGVRDPEGVTRLVRASSLTGLAMTDLEKVGQMLGLTTYDYASALEDANAGRTSEGGSLGRSFVNSYTDLAITDLRNQLEPESFSVGTGLPGAEEPEAEVDERPEFMRIRERVAERYARHATDDAEIDQADLEGLDAQLGRLRMLLLLGTDEEELIDPVTGEPIDPITGEPIDPVTGEPMAPGSRPDPASMLPAGPTRRESESRMPAILEPGGLLGDEPEEDETETDTEVPVATPIEELGVVLRHGQRVDRLATLDQTRFDHLMAAGEKLLREGKYFWAERRFVRALRFTPGHPIATIGVAHAQLGAGLYLSASLTLHSLFVFQPEMIDATYDPGLIPNRPRLLAAVTVLEDRLAQDLDVAESAFMYAYVGRLLGERDIVERGLDRMAEARADDAMVPLLRTIWLAPVKPKPAAEAAPAGGEPTP
jgi:hypothetical protein